MPILNIQTNVVGQAGVEPSYIYIDTNDTVATVISAGFLNGLVASGTPISTEQLAVVSTKTSPSARTSSVSVYSIVNSGGNWSLVNNESSIFPVVIDGSGNMTGVDSITGSGTATFPNAHFNVTVGGTGAFGTLDSTSLFVTNSLSGGNVVGAIINDNTAANSGALLTIQTTSNGGGTAGGSPYINFQQVGFQQMNVGFWANSAGGDGLFHFSYGAFSSNDPLIIGGNSPQVKVNGDMTSSATITGASVNTSASRPGAIVTSSITNTSAAAHSDTVFAIASTNSGAGNVGGSTKLSWQSLNYALGFVAGIWSTGNSGDNCWHFTSGISYTTIDPIIIDTNNNVKILLGASGSIAGPNMVYASGYTGYAGGSVTQTITVAGMVNGDKVFAVAAATTTVGAYVLNAVAGAGVLTITWSADPAVSQVNWFAIH